MMRLKRVLVYSTVLLVISCGGGDGGDGGNPNPQPPEIQAPSAATLVFPEDNTECNISEVLSDTQSVVPFEWNASENTDSYRINITNLNTNVLVISNTVPSPEAMITLERGTPYAWFVVSQANGTNETATSATFRFFNEGPGIENYAPFPAEAVSPARGSTIATTNMVGLEWSASDIDNDALSFTVLFDTNENPTTEVGTLTETTLEVATSPGTTYFWRVITMDSANNSSQSEVFQFRVE